MVCKQHVYSSVEAPHCPLLWLVLVSARIMRMVSYPRSQSRIPSQPLHLIQWFALTRHWRASAVQSVVVYGSMVCMTCGVFKPALLANVGPVRCADGGSGTCGHVWWVVLHPVGVLQWWHGERPSCEHVQRCGRPGVVLQTSLQITRVCQSS